MEAPHDSKRQGWLREARRTAHQVNLGWWFDRLSGPLIISGVAGACVLLLVRRQWPEISVALLASITAGITVAVALTCWLLARRRFESAADSLVRLEASMQLRSALSAASAGVTPWPALPTRVDRGVRWKYPRLVLPPFVALAFLSAGLWIPLDPARAQERRFDEPLAWNDLEADLEQLKNEDTIDQSYVEEMRKKLDELRAQKEEEWFSHSSLEATDQLKAEHASELEQLDREANRALDALENLQKADQGMSAAQKENLLQQFDQALQGLQKGQLKPNAELLDKLKGLDPSKLGKLSPEQLEQLKENLRKTAGACQNCNGNGKNSWADEMLDGNGGGEGDQPGDRPGQGGGKGGINRGPGEAGNPLGPEGEKAPTGEATGLEAKDLSNSLPGDLLELQDDEHKVDTSPTAPQQGGSAANKGSGGDRVWEESLDPEEQRALKRFFK